MSKIVYGVSGQGFGHAARSKEIIKYLMAQGHQVMIFTYDQGLFFLDPSWRVLTVPGLGLSYKNNKLIYWRTVSGNIKQVAKRSKDWPKILAAFRQFDPDLVITDFEPLSAMLAKIQRLPLISLDNQHQLTNTKIKIPLARQPDLLTDKLIIKSLVWGAYYYLITSFFTTPITKKNTFLFTPILRQEIMALRPKQEDYFLVYQTSDFKSLVAELKKIKQRFVVFGFNLEKTEGNIEFKNYSSDDWLDYLANCRAIIGNAGLSLISEALHLAKPYLAVPVSRQIEQVVNAHYLEQAGYGLAVKKFNSRDFEKFYSNLANYQKQLDQYQRSDNSAIFKKLDEIIGLWT